MVFLYVLELVSNKWYVGTTENVPARFQQHKSGFGGSAWTKRYKPVRITETKQFSSTMDARNEETLYTCKLMMEHGVNNVRGGPFCLTRGFTTLDIGMLSSMIGHVLDMDYKVVTDHLKQALKEKKKKKKTPKDQQCTVCMDDKGNNDPTRPLCHPCFQSMIGTRRKRSRVVKDE